MIMSSRKLKKMCIRDRLIPDKKVFTNEIIKITVDVAYYWAKVFLVEHPELYWGIITLKQMPDYMFPNEPGLLGFKDEFFQPCHMTHVMIIKTKRDPNGTYMYDTYKYWEENYIGGDSNK